MAEGEVCVTADPADPQHLAGHGVCTAGLYFQVLVQSLKQFFFHSLKHNNLQLNIYGG